MHLKWKFLISLHSKSAFIIFSGVIWFIFHTDLITFSDLSSVIFSPIFLRFEPLLLPWAAMGTSASEIVKIVTMYIITLKKIYNADAKL